MDNAQALLGLLCAAPAHGYDLKHIYDRFFGVEKPLPFGQVYATLARMIRDGLIVALEQRPGAEPSGGPIRKRYAVSAQGRAHLLQWVYAGEVPSPTLRSNLFARTVIALLLNENAEALLETQRGTHMGRMRELTQQKQGAPLAELLVIDLALFHTEADLRWIDLTRSRIEQLRNEVMTP